MADDQLSDLSKRIVSRTRNLIDEARRRGITLRVLGGIAVIIHSEGVIPPVLLREIRDADLVVEKGKVKQLTTMFRELGYDENRRFNLVNGRERLIYVDPENKTQLDVFVGEFNMCHRLSLDARLAYDSYTLPLAEVLLTKLQIVQLNDKDLKDILLVLQQHDVQEDVDEERINISALASHCASDWGLCKTVVDNLSLSLDKVPGIGLQERDRAAIESRIGRVAQAIEDDRPDRAAHAGRLAICRRALDGGARRSRRTGRRERPR
jgi:hypothetical protein